jgi:hypothetical protein
MKAGKLLTVLAAAVVAALAAVLFLDWRKSAIQAERNRLSIVPHQFAVRKILYAEEKCSGIGLSGGDNCTGVLVYELPPSTSGAIQQHGLAYFRDLGQTLVNKDSGPLGEWQTTPVAPNPEWVWREHGAQLPPPTLSGFLGHESFLIDVDSKIEREINDSIVSPGSFFAYDRYGVMLVIPAKNKMAYAYRN